MDNTIDVLLSDGTVGWCLDSYTLGDIAEIYLHDENGNLISVVGEIADIL